MNHGAKEAVAGRIAAVAVIALALLAPAAHATVDQGGPVILKAGMDTAPLDGHVSMLRDDSGALTIDDVRAPDPAGQFQPGDGTDFNHPSDGVAWWYRFTLKHPGAGDIPSNWVLRVGTAWLDYVDVYLGAPSQAGDVYRMGDQRPPAQGQIPNPHFAVPVQVPPGQAVTIHIRVQTAASHNVLLSLTDLSAFSVTSNRTNIIDGAFFGALLIMIIYNLVIYLQIRDRAYLYFVFWLGALVGLVFVALGYARMYGNGLHPMAPALISGSFRYTWVLVGLTTILLAREFLTTRVHNPRWHVVTTAALGIAVFVLLLSTWLPYGLANLLGEMVVVMAFSVALVIAMLQSTKGLRQARIFLLAFGLPMLLSVATQVADHAGWFGRPYLMFPLYQLALCLGVALLSLSLADRINAERSRVSAAREQARRLKSYLPQKVADLVGEGDSELLEPKRRHVTVCVIDLRGFTPFSETSAPEDVMAVLKEFFETMGAIVEKHGGTVEHFAGDSMLIFFNAPLAIPNPEAQAVQSAIEMREAFDALNARWARYGHNLGLGIGISNGYATIGAIGFSGRSQYAAIGAVTNLASRLCSLAKHGEILTTTRVIDAVENLVETEAASEQDIKGFTRPIPVIRILRIK